MKKIGDRDVVYNGSFIIHSGEEALFDVPIGDPNIKISLVFDSASPDSGNSNTSWSFNDGLLRIVFKGWTNPLGSALIKPNKLGDAIDGRSFGFNVVHQHIGSVNYVNFELYLGGTY